MAAMTFARPGGMRYIGRRDEQEPPDVIRRDRTNIGYPPEMRDGGWKEAIKSLRLETGVVHRCGLSVFQSWWHAAARAFRNRNRPGEASTPAGTCFLGRLDELSISDSFFLPSPTVYYQLSPLHIPSSGQADVTLPSIQAHTPPEWMSPALVSRATSSLFLWAMEAPASHAAAYGANFQFPAHDRVGCSSLLQR